MAEFWNSEHYIFLFTETCRASFSYVVFACKSSASRTTFTCRFVAVSGASMAATYRVLLSIAVVPPSYKLHNFEENRTVQCFLVGDLPYKRTKRLYRIT